MTAEPRKVPKPCEKTTRQKLPATPSPRSRYVTKNHANLNERSLD